MKFIKLGAYRNKIEHEFVVIEKVDEFVFKRFSIFISCLNEKWKQYLPKFIDLITIKLEAKISESSINLTEDQLLEFTNKYENIVNLTHLCKLLLIYFIQELHISDKEFWSTEKTRLLNKNLQRAVILLAYFNTSTLCEIIGREEGIEFYKNYIETYCQIHDGPIISPINSLDDMRIKDIYNIRENQLGRVRIISEVVNGHYLRRCDTCEKAQEVEDIKDKEILEVIVCYCDFYITKLKNPSFVLTRKNTIIRGHPFCDEVYHDLRITKDLKHPQNDFFVNIKTNERGTH